MKNITLLAVSLSSLLASSLVYADDTDTVESTRESC